MDNCLARMLVRCTATRVTAKDRKQRQAEAAGVLWAVKAKAKPGCPLSISPRDVRRFGKFRARSSTSSGDERSNRLSKGSLSRLAKIVARSTRCSRRQPIPCPQDFHVRCSRRGESPCGAKRAIHIVGRDVTLDGYDLTDLTVIIDNSALEPQRSAIAAPL